MDVGHEQVCGSVGELRDVREHRVDRGIHADDDARRCRRSVDQFRHPADRLHGAPGARQHLADSPAVERGCP